MTRFESFSWFLLLRDMPLYYNAWIMFSNCFDGFMLQWAKSILIRVQSPIVYIAANGKKMKLGWNLGAELSATRLACRMVWKACGKDIVQFVKNSFRTVLYFRQQMFEKFEFVFTWIIGAHTNKGLISNIRTNGQSFTCMASLRPNSAFASIMTNLSASRWPSSWTYRNWNFTLRQETRTFWDSSYSIIFGTLLLIAP